MNADPKRAPPPSEASSLFGDAPQNESKKGYVVLARKYRPTVFADMIGQEALVTTISNAIAQNKLAQAYIFTGVRGVGKTSAARIIARAINCIGADGNGSATATPCGVCANCVAIRDDRHVDVIEMDAASNTGVDEMREVIDAVRYGPVQARYKVYIIDEVHMLSKNAFNALLKTLEEPPAHTKFIFATTEIRKVPVTVLSRCQRFDLKRIDATLLADHFNNILKKEMITAEDDAVRMIARAADGSVRDGLSLLDQAIAREAGKVTAAGVSEMLGLADRGQIIALYEHLLKGDLAATLALYEKLHGEGLEPLVMLSDMAHLTHLLTRAKVIDADDLPQIEREFLVRHPGLSIPHLSRIWQVLQKGIEEVAASTDPHRAAEMILIRIGYLANMPLPADLIRTLDGQRTDAQKNTSAAPSTSAPTPGKTPPSALRKVNNGAAEMMAAPAPQTEIVAAPAPITDFRALVALFAEKREVALYTILRERTHLVRLERGKLIIRLEKDVPANAPGRIAEALTKWTGERFMVMLSDDVGSATLAEEEKAAANQKMTAIAAHPDIAAVIAAFPAAKIVAVRDVEADTITPNDEGEV